MRAKLAALDGEMLGAQPEFEDCRRLAARAAFRCARSSRPRPRRRGWLARAGKRAVSADDRSALDGLVQAAQVLAVGTGESQLHAAAEHVARALGADSVSLLAVLANPEVVYLVADSGEIETGRMRYAARRSTRTFAARSRSAR